MFFNRRIHSDIRPLIQQCHLDAATFRRYAEKISRLPQPFTPLDIDQIFAGADDDLTMSVLLLLSFHDLDENGVHALNADEKDLLTRSKNYADIVDVLANLI